MKDKENLENNDREVTHHMQGINKKIHRFPVKKLGSPRVSALIYLKC